MPYSSDSRVTAVIGLISKVTVAIGVKSDSGNRTQFKTYNQVHGLYGPSNRSEMSGLIADSPLWSNTGPRSLTNRYSSSLRILVPVVAKVATLNP